MFPLFRSALNRRNNAKILSLLHDRAKRLPTPLAFVFAAFSSVAHATIEEIWDRQKNLPKLFPEKTGDLTSDQFFRLYHATIWSFVTLYSFELGREEAQIVSRACAVFVGPLEKEPTFAEHVVRVIEARGSPEFLSMKLHAHYREVLGFTADRDPAIALLALFMSAYGQARLAIHETRTNRIIEELFPNDPSA